MCCAGRGVPSPPGSTCKLFPSQTENGKSLQVPSATSLQLCSLALPSGLAECDPANYVRSQVAKSALCPEETGAATELTEQQFC